jgi:microcystin-dependent protein
MADNFIAEIRIFGFNFPPTGWAFCAGQLMPISQNTALFSLLGTIYGGDGKTTFALPNLQDNAPLGQGQGLSSYDLGQSGGAPFISLNTNELPSHNHSFAATTSTGTTLSSAGNQPAKGASGSKGASNSANIYSTNANKATTNMSPLAINMAGAGLPHNNMQPYLTLNFCIALQGIYPQRS